MTSQFTNARYAIWNHEAQYIGDPMEWRVTPKSKDVLSIARPARLKGTVRVIASPNRTCLSVEIDREQAANISHWTSGLPDDVIRTTAESDGYISHNGTYLCLDSTYCCTPVLPRVGQIVVVRLVPEVVRIGSMRKAQLRITDVLLPDIAED